jgi:hypothetical protein
MIYDENKSNYIDKNGKAHDDRKSRMKAAKILNNYFGDNNCNIYFCDRFNGFDIRIEYNNKIYYCDVKSNYFWFNAKYDIGFDKETHDKISLLTKEGKIKDSRILMFYTNKMAVYDVMSPDFKINYLLNKEVNDRAKGKQIKDFVQVNNNIPTVVFPI